MAKPLKLRSDSLMLVYGTVTADHDLTGVPTFVALPQSNTQPAPADFQTATEVSVTEDDGMWTKRFSILIGPGGSISKAPGLYMWTVKLTDSPEAPVLAGGKVQITAV